MFFFFFNDPATTEIYTLSLHDALPISTIPRRRRRARARRSLRSGRIPASRAAASPGAAPSAASAARPSVLRDRKSTRLNSSHVEISYAVFCLKKKKNNKKQQHTTQKSA